MHGELWTEAAFHAPSRPQWHPSFPSLHLWPGFTLQVCGTSATHYPTVIQARDQMTPWVPPSSSPPPHQVKSQVPTFYLPHVSGFTLSGPWGLAVPGSGPPSHSPAPDRPIRASVMFSVLPSDIPDKFGG